MSSVLSALACLAFKRAAVKWGIARELYGDTPSQQKSTQQPPAPQQTQQPPQDLHDQHLEDRFTQLTKNVAKALGIDIKTAGAGISKHLELGNIGEWMTNQQAYDWILAEAERKAATKKE